MSLALEEREIPVYSGNKVVKANLASLVTVLKTRLPMDMSNIGQKLIICTGGKSAPFTGSDGSGYALAQSLGHKSFSFQLSPAKTDYKNLGAGWH